MNLKTLKRQAKKVFTQAERLGFVQKVTYKRVLGVDYDTTLGEDTITYEPHEIKCHLTDFNRNELTNDIRTSDVKGIILKDEITFTPTIDDVVKYNEIEYTVISFVNSPELPVIILQLRGGA